MNNDLARTLDRVGKETSDQAIHPGRDTLLNIAKTMKQAEIDEKSREAGNDPEDISLSNLVDMPGWKILKKYIQRTTEALKPQYDFNDKFDDDDFFRSFGMRSIIYDIIQSFSRQIINRVEDAREAIESDKWTGGGTSRN